MLAKPFGSDVAVPIVGDNKAKIGLYNLPTAIDNNLPFTVVIWEVDQLLHPRTMKGMLRLGCSGKTLIFKKGQPSGMLSHSPLPCYGNDPSYITPVLLPVGILKIRVLGKLQKAGLRDSGTAIRTRQ